MYCQLVIIKIPAGYPAISTNIYYEEQVQILAQLYLSLDGGDTAYWWIIIAFKYIVRYPCTRKFTVLDLKIRYFHYRITFDAGNLKT